MSEDKRIYRTVGTGADYKFVTKIPTDTTTYSDTISARALGESIPSLFMLQPPPNGHSVLSLANGAHAKHR